MSIRLPTHWCHYNKSCTTFQLSTYNDTKFPTEMSSSSFHTNYLTTGDYWFVYVVYFIRVPTGTCHEQTKRVFPLFLSLLTFIHIPLSYTQARLYCFRFPTPLYLIQISSFIYLLYLSTDSFFPQSGD